MHDIEAAASGRPNVVRLRSVQNIRTRWVRLDSPDLNAPVQAFVSVSRPNSLQGLDLRPEKNYKTTFLGLHLQRHGGAYEHKTSTHTQTGHS